jgi:hypothetical protein
MATDCATKVATWTTRDMAGSLAGGRSRASWPKAFVYNAAIPKETDRAACEWIACGARVEWETQTMIVEGGFLMLDPVGQGVLCG